MSRGFKRENEGQKMCIYPGARAARAPHATKNFSAPGILYLTDKNDDL